MSQICRFRRTTSLGAVAVLCLGIGWVAVAPASAADRTSVSVFLKAPDPATLATLANAQGLTHAQRVAAVERVLPTAVEHQRAAQALSAEGFTVTGQSAWSVTATGTTSSVLSQFGARPSLAAHPTGAQRQAATGALPRLPSALRGVAIAAFPTSGGPAAFHHATLAGSDFRNAYTAPGIAPDSGQDSAGTVTIATIQLSGWNESDLTNYAGEHGPAGFNVGTAVTEVPVDQASVPGPPVSLTDQGDVEVDLDQESILSTDPYAHQRPYFAPNTSGGYIDALSKVLDDVLQNGSAYSGGDKKIVALSTSWGSCESDSDNPSGTNAAMNTVIQSLVAAGVTMFAATGDNGIYDCMNNSVAVDYPASSPNVVGVGGTSLSAAGTSAANNGSNWHETGWSCSTESACTSPGGGGGGGGASTTFAKPAYQSVIADAPFAASTQRLVPDIAADADPATGFEVYTSDLGTVLGNGGNHDVQIGGTSLASPISAALFTNALSAGGATTGIGDIHQQLYSAYAANDGAFRDITSGSNGASADKSTDPSVSAQAGYDTVGGLGAPLWPTVLGQPSTSAAPTLTASMKLVHPHSSSSPRRITARWSAKSGAGGAPVKAVALAITRVGATKALHATSTAKATGSYSFTGKPGASYTLHIDAVDTIGGASKPHAARVVVPIDDKQFTHHGRWRRLSKSSANGGSILTTDASGASARVTATGRAYYLIVQAAPNRGKLAVYRSGKRIKTINLYRSKSKYERIRIFGSTTSAASSHRFTIRCLGSKSAASSSPTIDIDAMVATS